ncbi:class I SAM-dependent methyltransferase [Paenibacillus solisilvae]|uniref:Class I SAM-dependent methyltransferase n=1 Tax=Paenibacillus solisilvae TaxID=2486751 RepID=A0ABW0W2P4_9BACL
MDNQNEVSSRFDAAAAAYDSQRRKLIPCFDDFYDTAIALADASTDSPAVLDLGAGTGLLSSLLLQKYPAAKVTLIDISEKMLDLAKLRLAQYPNVSFVLGDYTCFHTSGPCDIILSALSIHHLTDANKAQLYQTVYTNLRENGIFINADQVLGHTPFVDALYKEDWKAKVEASGLTQEELTSAYERTKLDRMAPLAAQLNWLGQAGFTEVDCVYKYFNFAVLYARKGSPLA